MTDLERFESKFVKGDKDECWLWNSGINGDYGVFYVADSWFLAHVYSFMTYSGPLESKEVHHKCRNKLCVNPNHLTLLTCSTHSSITSKFIRKKVWDREECPRGHKLTEKNTTEVGTCKTCLNMLKRRRHNKKKLENSRKFVLEKYQKP